MLLVLIFETKFAEIFVAEDILAIRDNCLYFRHFSFNLQFAAEQVAWSSALPLLIVLLTKILPIKNVLFPKCFTHACTGAN